MDPADLRKYPRVVVAFPVEYRLSGKNTRARATMLGGGGLFLRMPGLMPSGAEFHLRFQPGRKLPPVEAEARVCYQVPGSGIGIEFTRIREEDRSLLLQVILQGQTKRRQFPRAPVVVQVETEDGISLAYGRQLNAGGIFIETNKILPLDSRLHLRFHVENHGEVITALAEVKDVVPGFGVGVQFIALDASDEKRIEEYVAQSLIQLRPMRQ